MPVREALHRLAIVGVLETSPRKSPYAPKANRKLMRDILSLRIDLECKAAVSALGSDGGGLIQSLRVINAKTVTQGTRPKPHINKYLRLNQQFHFEIYRRCSKDVILTPIELLWMRYGPLLNLLDYEGENFFKHSMHEDIIQAIETMNSIALCPAISDGLTIAPALIERNSPPAPAIQLSSLASLSPLPLPQQSEHQFIETEAGWPRDQ